MPFFVADKVSYEKTKLCNFYIKRQDNFKSFKKHMFFLTNFGGIKNLVATG